MLQQLDKSLVSSLRVIVILTACLLLIGCASQRPVEVIDSAKQKKSARQTHSVIKGETLYSIAWRYGVDYRELADFNGITPPYTIHSGQKIRIDLNALSPKKNTKNNNSASLPKARSKSPKNAVVTKRPEKIRSENKTEAVDLASNNSLSQGTPKWQWPASGKLIARFQGETGLNKGIDIGANLGESVLAAASGQVVYAGTGLRGYGKLLIIKHNDIFLSAYAHNSELLVKEGDLVKVGQRIADMGSSGTNRVKLHFEIRSEGKPVDPLKYLPKR